MKTNVAKGIREFLTQKETEQRGLREIKKRIHKDATALEIFRNLQFVPILIKNINENQSDETLSLTLSVLELFMHKEESRDQVSSHPDTLKKLIQILKEKKNSSMQLLVCKVICSLLSNQVCQKLESLKIVKILLQNLEEYVVYENKEIGIRTLSHMCINKSAWRTIIKKKGVEYLCRAGISTTNPKLLLVTLKSLKYFCHSVVDGFEQMADGTNKFQTCREVIASDDCSDKVRETIFELFLTMFNQHFLKTRTRTETKRFLILFEHFQSSMISRYLFQYLLQDKYPMKYRMKLLSFFHNIVTIWGPVLSQSKFKTTSILSQIRIIGPTSFVILFMELKQDTALRCHTLSLLDTLTSSEMGSLLGSKLFPLFIKDLSQAYDQSTLFIGSCIPLALCGHLDLRGGGINETDVLRQCVSKVKQGYEKTEFMDCVKTLDYIWKILAKVTSTEDSCICIRDLFIPRLIEHYETSPIVLQSSLGFLKLLPRFRMMLQSVLETNMVTKLISANHVSPVGCFFCLTTSTASKEFILKMKNVCTHNSVCFEEIEKRLKLSAKSKGRLQALITFPHISGCYDLSMKIYQKHDIINELLGMLSSDIQDEFDLHKYASGSLKAVLSQVKMSLKLERPDFNESIYQGRFIERHPSPCAYARHTTQDLKVVVGQTVFGVDRKLLSSASRVLAAMLYGSFQEANTDTINFEHCSAPVFRQMIHGVYGCYCDTISCHHLIDLLDLFFFSDMYELANLKQFVIYRLGEVLCSGRSQGIGKFEDRLPLMDIRYIDYFFCEILRRCDLDHLLEVVHFLKACTQILGGNSVYFKDFNNSNHAVCKCSFVTQRLMHE